MKLIDYFDWWVILGLALWVTVDVLVAGLIWWIVT